MLPTYSIIRIKHCSALKPLHRRQCELENILSKNGYIWSYIRYIWSYIGLKLSLSMLSSFLNAGLTLAYFNAVEKAQVAYELLKLWKMKKDTRSLLSLITFTGILVGNFYW